MRVVIKIAGDSDGSDASKEFFQNLFDSFAEFALATAEDFNVDLDVSFEEEQAGA